MTRIPWIDYPISAIDLETTGIGSGSRIVQIGLVCVDRGAVTMEWSTLVNPGVPIPKSATRVHGIGNRDVRASPGTAAALRELAERSSVGIPLAYNARFDRRILHAEAARCGVARACRLLDPSWTGWIDPLVWARRRFRFVKGKGRHRLGNVATRLGLPPAPTHEALSDARTAVLVMFGLWRLGRIPDDLGELLDSQGRLGRSQDDDHDRFVARSAG